MATINIPLSKPYDRDSLKAKVNTRPIITQIIISALVASAGIVLIALHKDIYWGLLIFGETTIHLSHLVGIALFYFSLTAVIASIRKQRDIAQEETRNNHTTFLYYVVHPAVRQFFPDETKWHNGFFVNITYDGKTVIDAIEQDEIRELYYVYLDKHSLRVEESALTALKNTTQGVK